MSGFFSFLTPLFHAPQPVHTETGHTKFGWNGLSATTTIDAILQTNRKSTLGKRVYYLTNLYSPFDWQGLEKEKETVGILTTNYNDMWHAFYFTFSNNLFTLYEPNGVADSEWPVLKDTVKDISDDMHKHYPNWTFKRGESPRDQLPEEGSCALVSLSRCIMLQQKGVESLKEPIDLTLANQISETVHIGRYKQFASMIATSFCCDLLFNICKERSLVRRFLGAVMITGYVEYYIFPKLLRELL